MRTPGKVYTCVVSFLFYALIAASTLYAQSLPRGIWDMISNGSRGRLNINLIDGQGNVTGTYIEGTSTSQISGFWNENERKFTFVRTFPNGPSVIQVYTGYLCAQTFCCVGDPTYNRMLTGSFEAFSSTGGSAQRSVFGWAALYCTIP